MHVHNEKSDLPSCSVDEQWNWTEHHTLVYRSSQKFYIQCYGNSFYKLKAGKGLRLLHQRCSYTHLQTLMRLIAYVCIL